MAEKQGFLTKEGGKFKTWRKRWMVLRQGAIYYSKNQSSGELGIVKLEGTTTVTDSTRKGKKNCFQIATPGVKRIFYLFAESEAEKAEWMAALKTTIEKKKAGVDLQKEQKVGLDDFDLLKVIGKGSFGKVIQVAKKDTGKIYAMKVLNKKTIIERNEMEHTKAEKNILQKLVHPFLVNLHYSFQTPEKLYFIMDYVNGGELFFHLQQEEKFPEERVRFYGAEICLGLEYLHSSGVLYRDLKPENILLTNAGHICLTDFGISKEGLESDDARTATFCGTPEYLAPEVLAGKGYGKAVDWWSFGTLIFEMLTGLPPFYSQDVQQMYSKIMNEELVVPDTVSADAKSIVIKLLERDPEKRLKEPDQIKKQPFFAPLNFEKLLLFEVEPPYKPPVKDELSTVMIDPSFTSEKPQLDAEGGADAAYAKNFDNFTYVNPAAKK